MASIGNATPLISLDALVIDTETTGLEPAKARIVEIDVVPLKAGRLAEAASLRQLVNPGVLIPEEVARIHKIDDAVVRRRQPSPTPGRVSPQRCPVRF